ncbi:MAG: hypothetical protein GYB31_19135 [Bacteroidetes bacterium]|nr:hypothetical protein [Bacteroidota bacterium]
MIYRLLFFALLLPACNSVSQSDHSAKAVEPDTILIHSAESLPEFDWAAFGIWHPDQQEKPDISTYSRKREEVDAIRRKLKSAYDQNSITIDSVGKRFEYLLLNEIMPYWYGTPWDFEGHTDIPGEGYVACGYLVSTTLRHMGIRVNRYKLAQQAALYEAKTLALDQPVKSYIGPDNNWLIQQLPLDLEAGIYIVGLDYHVGLLLIRKGQVFMLHSSYYHPSEVVIERAEDSMAFQYNDDYYVAPISTNPTLMKAWLRGVSIQVLEP